MRSLLVALTLVATGPAILAGQRLAPAYPRWEPDFQSSAPASVTHLFPKAPDYRWEGLVVGGALVGFLGATLGGGLCGSDDSAAEGFLIGATVGGVTGGLLGTLIPKTPPDSSDHS